MRRILALLAIVCSCGLNTCLPSPLEQVQTGLKNVTTDIQEPEQFKRIVGWSESFTGIDGKCQYARENWLLGTEISSTQALDDLTRFLESEGWMLMRDPSSNLTADTSRTLLKGDHAYIVVTTAISPFTKQHLDGIQVAPELVTLVLVTINYVDPARVDC